MGGWLTQEIAIRSQARIKSITLVNSVGILIDGNPVANLFAMKPDQIMRAVYADPEATAEMVKTPTPEDIVRLTTNRAASARLGQNPLFHNPKLSKWLHRITVPTQIIWGAQDGVVSSAYAKEFKKFIPHASVTVFPDAGHAPFAERLDDTVKLVSDFVGRTI